ncbi:prepilin-type N-terminal cleavage/methylation domain-containing protein [Clostridium novyi]|uniref:Conserved protein, putative n=1 Tax=Clostridium novyi (strain NT) TaxID=386415 RepID=A0Q082_CLONN|nr:prepilin-type N-terminal cleavage/methylation domain-containing protein [Clostridium novyi]ABK60674.1 conserved protein, putative [Clostridium novyi NT]KEH85484.1 N-terminal cleavage protein [Clostridium novyi A str. NCTC 538]
MKKGYGLIEVLVTLFIISILMLIEVDLVTKESIRYKRNISLDREECYCNSALHFVENEINDIKNKSLIIKDNNIVLEKENGDKYTIKTEGNNGKYKLIILYDKLIDGNKNKNTIAEDLKDVKINKNKNVVYIYIESLKGKKFYKCIGLNQNIEDT